MRLRVAKRLPEYTTANARQLRKDSSDAERRLWAHLRRHALEGLKFRRQHPFGPYILDFYCPSAKLVIEVDGSQHYEPGASQRDEARTKYLESRGLRVIRFNNVEALLQTEAVFDVILSALGEHRTAEQ